MKMRFFTNQNIQNGEKVFELVEGIDPTTLTVNNIVESSQYYIPVIGHFDELIFDCDTSDLEPGLYCLEHEDGEISTVIHGLADNANIWEKDNWVPSIDGIGNLLETIEKTDVSAAPNAPFISSCGTNIFEPVFYNDDNLLNKLMKTALCYKGINLDTYREKFDNTSDFNNNRRHLLDQKYTSLSMSKFAKMCEIFELDYSVSVTDKPGSKHPMNRDITMTSGGEGEGYEDLASYLEYIRGGSNNDDEDENDI